MALVDLLGRITRRARAPPWRRSRLAWLLSRMPCVVPIPSTTKLARLDENIGAAGNSADDLREIEDAKITVQGARYPEELMRMSGL